MWSFMTGSGFFHLAYHFQGPSMLLHTQTFITLYGKSFHCTHVSYFIYPCTDKYLDGFHLLAIKSNAAQTFMIEFLCGICFHFLEYRPRSGIGG